MRSIRHKESLCLNCSKRLDAAMGVRHNGKPRPGSITICIDCHHVMAYAWDMSLRELTSQEVTDIAGNKDLLRAMGALAKLKESKLWKEKHQ